MGSSDVERDALRERVASQAEMPKFTILAAIRAYEEEVVEKPFQKPFSS
jgi:hypothetical protein